MHTYVIVRPCMAIVCGFAQLYKIYINGNGNV